MNFTPPSIVFASSHPIALPLLQLLHDKHESGHLRLAGVISQPDRPSGRGKMLKPTIISQWATEHRIPLHRPEKPKESTVVWLKEHSCELLLVMAYGHMINRAIRELPKLGIFNFHTSLLPRFRGATPVEAALASGIEETGVSLMEIVQEMDAGDLLGSTSVPIAFHDTQTELTDKLSHAACSLCELFLPQILSGHIHKKPQVLEGRTFCRKLEAQDRFLDFHATAITLHRRICALTPRPGCVFEIADNVFKIRSTNINFIDFYPKTPGTLLKLPGPNAAIIAGDGKSLLIKEIQAPGKPFMPIADFLRGHELPWDMVSPSHHMKPLEHTSFPF